MSNLILNRVKNIECYSVLAVDTIDVQDIENSYLFSRYIFYENNQLFLKEDFVGIIALDILNAKSITYKILSSLNNWGLDLYKFVGQRYKYTMVQVLWLVIIMVFSIKTSKRFFLLIILKPCVYFTSPPLH